MTRKISLGLASLSKNSPSRTNTREVQDFWEDDEPDARAEGGWQPIITERLRLLSVAGPWAAWVGYTCKRQRLRRAKQLLHSGWSQREVQHWSSYAYAEEATRGRAQKNAALVAREAERRIEMGKRVVKHMLRHQLAAAWGHFVLCVDNHRSTREVTRKVVARMRCTFSHSALYGDFI
jgi:hypothetical protein